MSSIVGVAGLPATYQAICAGKRVGLANKEVLVSAGKLVMDAVRQSGSQLIPIDSEHNGAHQCLRAGNRAEVTKLILTASGGPFRAMPIGQLSFVTPEDALKHPTWKMGNRITIDSATLMNKGFEVIEARWLFGMRLDQIEVVIHPQSTVHSMVEFVDSSVLAQLGPTDMRMPIQYALTYPERIASNQVALDWTNLKRLDFEKVSTRRFPCLRLAKEALKKGGALPCALNAADEVAVGAFLTGRLAFLGIPEVIDRVLGRTPRRLFEKIEDVLTADAEARRMAKEEVDRLAVTAVAAS
jgi:1-deoxy-D-xylulose-5-phosphate reductoisomerase